jgi:putative transposase
MGDRHQYIRTAEHWLYLCVVLDLYSGLVVGWSMSPRPDRQWVVQAVLMAVWQRPGRTPVLLHSDRGCQGGFNRSTQHL